MKRYSMLLGLLLTAFTMACGSDTVKVPPAPPAGGGEETAVNMWGIDMTVLEIDRKYYAVWSGWDAYYDNREGDGQYLYIARMTFHDQKPLVRLGERVLLAKPELAWEQKVNEHISLVEGPTALCHGDDVFILYSTRGSWTDNYKMGQLRLKSRQSDPLDLRSWEKKQTPVFQGLKEADGKGYLVHGVGHACFTTSPDGTEHWINYHSKTTRDPGWDDRKVFFQRFTFDAGGNPDFGIPANPAEPMTRPSGEVEIERADGVADPSPTFMNPTRVGADPWIVKHDGKYYTCRSIERGIWVTESRFLSRFENGQSWEQARRRVWTPPAVATDKWNIRQHWAPELHFIEGKWYIFYAAGKQTAAPYWQHRAGVLVSQNGPFGPYEEHDDGPLFTGEIVKKR